MPCREATASVIGAFLGNDKHHLLIVLSRQVGLARQGFSRISQCFFVFMNDFLYFSVIFFIFQGLALELGCKKGTGALLAKSSAGQSKKLLNIRLHSIWVL